jgi:hypothetical protein
MDVMMSEEIGLQSANKDLVKDLPDRHDQLHIPSSFESVR